MIKIKRISNEKINEYADKIIEAENELLLGKNLKKNRKKILKIIDTLSLEETLRLEICIKNKK